MVTSRMLSGLLNCADLRLSPSFISESSVESLTCVTGALRNEMVNSECAGMGNGRVIRLLWASMEAPGKAQVPGIQAESEQRSQVDTRAMLGVRQ